MQRAEARSIATRQDGSPPTDLLAEEIKTFIDTELEDEWTEPVDREESWCLWVRVMEQRFMNGRDDQVNYESIDGDPELDDKAAENNQIQDEYFEDQEAEWEVEMCEVQGETGLQDF